MKKLSDKEAAAELCFRPHFERSFTELGSGGAVREESRTAVRRIVRRMTDEEKAAAAADILWRQRMFRLSPEALKGIRPHLHEPVIAELQERRRLKE